MNVFFKTTVTFLIIFTVFVFCSQAKTQEPKFKQTISRDIYIRGEITTPMAFAINKQLSDLNAEGNELITVHITSPGGEVYAGLQIYDYIMASKAPVKMLCEGMCMSMAAYLLSSGKIRESSAHATIMFHQVGTKTEGKINELLADIAEAERLQSVLNDMLGKRSGMSVSDMNKMESYDHFMGPEEAKKLNLIDNIVEK